MAHKIKHPTTVEELLTMSGYKDDVTPENAIDLDWLGCIAETNSEIIDACRLTHMEEARQRKQRLRRALDQMRRVCVAWEKNL